jgi:hypothetical protein
VAAVINVINATNSAITGSGKIDGQGMDCWDRIVTQRPEWEAKGFIGIVDFEVKRRTILVTNSSDITLKDMRIYNSGFWTIHVLYSSYVTIDGIVVRNNDIVFGNNKNTDGLDIDSTTHVLIQNTDLDTNDDDFCLKSGKNWDGQRVNRTTEYVVIRNSIARRGHGGIVLGSETSASIRHVWVQNVTITGGNDIAIRIKSALPRGGTLEDIHINNITIGTVGVAIGFNMGYTAGIMKIPDDYNGSYYPEYWHRLLREVDPPELGIPHFQDFHISDINVKNATTAFDVSALNVSKITDIYLSDLYIRANKTGGITDAVNWNFNNMTIKTLDIHPQYNSYPLNTRSIGWLALSLLLITINYLFY